VVQNLLSFCGQPTFCSADFLLRKVRWAVSVEWVNLQFERWLGNEKTRASFNKSARKEEINNALFKINNKRGSFQRSRELMQLADRKFHKESLGLCQISTAPSGKVSLRLRRSKRKKECG
jgi:hypothetical protein